MNNEIVLSIAKRITKSLWPVWRRRFKLEEIFEEAYAVVEKYAHDRKTSCNVLEQKVNSQLGSWYQKNRRGGMKFSSGVGNGSWASRPIDTDKIRCVEFKITDNGCGDGDGIKGRGDSVGSDSVNEALFTFDGQIVELVDFVNKAIGEMPAVQGQVAIECIIRGESEGGFARKHGVTVRTVRNYKSKAQAAFRKFAERRSIKMEDFLRN